MTDPYKVIGVSPSATDEEIKEAYRNLAKKYHPDQYAESPLKEVATEKMKEINEAYDEITAQRKGKNTNNSTYNNPRSSGYGAQGYGRQSYGGYNNVNQNANSEFPDVRTYIQSGRIADAEQILNGVPDGKRSAEWYFLKGSVLYRRGWLEEARNHFSRACEMDPSNAEYAQAYNQTMNQRTGNYGGYSPQYRDRDCNTCDICNALICADCCCECMGGDLIPCC